MNNTDIHRNSNISRDVYSSRDAYASNDPYSKKNPYENNNAHQKKNETEKISSEYGYGLYCDHFFNIENVFRTKFTDDTQIHTEKREYTGTGDIASVFPKMSLITTNNYFIIVLTIILSSFLIMVFNNKWVEIGSFVFFLLIYTWRFICPSYLIIKSKQYVIGEEYKNLYKSYNAFINFFQITNMFLSSLLVYVSLEKYKSLTFLINTSLEYIEKNLPIIKKIISMKNINLNYNGFEYLSVEYFLITLVSFIMLYYYKNNVVKKKYVENEKDIKLKRLTNLFQRKSLILDGI